MKVNFCGYKYPDLEGSWLKMYQYTAKAFDELGFDIAVSPFLEWNCTYKKTIINSYEDIYVYNHTFLSELRKEDFWIGRKTLILKPTGPTDTTFTVDTEGYAAASSITYTKPEFENIDETDFFEKTVPYLINSKANKWDGRQDLQFLNESVDTPKNHILLIGQMPADETVTKMSFGYHWSKLAHIVKTLESYGKNLVIKIHPTLKTECKKEDWDWFFHEIKIWQQKHTVFYDFESLYEILPNTKVAIVENSTAGIECLIHQVPIISFGYPEYHWVTKDLRHLNCLIDYVEDLSWWDRSLANKWLAWYCTQYQCFDYKSTLNRIQYLMEDI